MEETSPASERALLEELRRHRAELRESMSALEDVLAAAASADRSRWIHRVQAALAEVSGDFRAHIDITEGPHGLYGEVLKASPRLAGAVDGLRREHELIGSQVAQLLTRVAVPDVIADVDGVRRAGTALLGGLVRHRQRGSDLVFEAYEYDIGGET